MRKWIKDWGPMAAIDPADIEPGDMIMGVQHHPRYWELWDDPDWVTALQRTASGISWEVVAERDLAVSFPWNMSHYLSVVIKKR